MIYEHESSNLNTNPPENANPATSERILKELKEVDDYYQGMEGKDITGSSPELNRFPRI
jgi:hypothetical protein